MTDKRAEALEGLRKVAQGLTEDIVDGNPTANIHTYVWSVLHHAEVLIESFRQTGQRERETSTDAPSLRPDYPGGKHRLDSDDENLQEHSEQFDWLVKQALDQEYTDLATSSLQAAADRYIPPCSYYGVYGGDCAVMLKKYGKETWCPACLQKDTVENSLRGQTLQKEREFRQHHAARLRQMAQEIEEGRWG